MEWLAWYNTLRKPAWTPSPRVIGLAWTILYPIIAVSFGFVFVQVVRRNLPWQAALPLSINLVANLVFTSILFSLRNLPLAAFDILLVLGTIVWSAAAIWPYYRWFALAQLPYFVWVGMATVLQISITWMNRSP